MKRSRKTIAADPDWASIVKVAECLHCSTTMLHNWGRAGIVGYRRIGPKRIEVTVSDTVEIYTTRYPNIAIDRETLDSLMHSTA